MQLRFLAGKFKYSFVNVMSTPENEWLGVGVKMKHLFSESVTPMGYV